MILGTSLVSLAYSIISPENSKHHRMNQIIKHCQVSWMPWHCPQQSQKPSEATLKPRMEQGGLLSNPERLTQMLAGISKGKEGRSLPQRLFQVTTNRREKSKYTKIL